MKNRGTIPWAARANAKLWSLFSVMVLTAIPGLFGLVVNQPWLFPSIGPTVFLQAYKPELSSAKFYNVTVGHLMGIIAGYFWLWLLAYNEPTVITTGEMQPMRLLASFLSLGTLIYLQIITGSFHPPAAATTLLITLGGFQLILKDVVALVIGIAIVAICGEFLRRARLGHVPRPGQEEG